MKFEFFVEEKKMLNVVCLASVVLSLIVVVFGNEVCYTGYGCFTDEAPFGNTTERPLVRLPRRPELINTRFYLHSRTGYREIRVGDVGSPFKTSMPIRFVVHGWLNSADTEWMSDTKNAILSVDDVYVILVDWRQSSFDLYGQSAVDTQIVGVEIARLIRFIQQKGQLKLTSIHCIGHSLGAHICGYAGKRIAGIGRITGLDPAGLLFSGTPPIVRLDSGDANYVDVIHTDAQTRTTFGFGMLDAIGHVDFYPNGGYDQPGCPKVTTSLMKLLNINIDHSWSDPNDTSSDLIACSHSAAHHYFRSSIYHPECNFFAYDCDSYESFLDGKCFKCAPDQACQRMSYHSWPKKLNSSSSSSLYLFTRGPRHSNVCTDTFMVQLKSSPDGIIARGKFFIKMTLNTDQTTTTLLDHERTTFFAGQLQYKLFHIVPIGVSSTLANVKNITIVYEKVTNFFIEWLYSDNWAFDSAVLYNELGNTVQFCRDSNTADIITTTSQLIKC